MAEVKNPKEINNPELSLNPNVVGKDAASAAPVSDTTKEIQSDLDDLISTSIHDSAEKQKIDFTATKSESDKKDEKKKALLRERKMPTYIIISSFVLVLLLAIGGL